MKRVKIMLSAILVMAIVAGAFAFKAKKSGTICLFQTTTTTDEFANETLTCKTVGQIEAYTTLITNIKQQVYTKVTKCTDVPYTPLVNCALTTRVILE